VLFAGVHTLPIRMTRHSENALHLARLLEAHPAVSHVYYPGLTSDPGHGLASSLVGEGADRFGGMVSFALTGAREAFSPFLDALRLCTIAVSLGDCSTLVWPWQSGNLIRVSVGLEDIDDLERDFRQALDRVLPAVAAD
jgi:methionine-gamma-lyase